MIPLVAIDIGGTHARFALAQVEQGRVVSLDAEITFKTADYASLTSAWAAFADIGGEPLPSTAAIAFAGPVRGDLLRLTNNPWTLRPDSIAKELGIDRLTLINDFGAVGHAVAQLSDRHFAYLAGPRAPLPATGLISIVGPGTGLGVAHVTRGEGFYHVAETEGGHIDYAPLDPIEDAIVAQLRAKYRRVSVERLVSGPGLADIHAALARIEGRDVPARDDAALWAAALDGGDSLAAAAFDRFCLAFGAVAGDIALAQGAAAMVIAGGLGRRIAPCLVGSGFTTRFTGKGRMERLLANIPVTMITHPQPGLYGAAAAFAQEHGE